MTGRTRKFIGTIVFVTGTTLYFLLAMALAVIILPTQPLWAHLLYYAGATVIWFLPSAALVRWMSQGER